MLETPQERVKLLKAGIDGKTIEKLYISYNDFKIIHSPILIEQVPVNIKQNNRGKNNRGTKMRRSRLEIIIDILEAGKEGINKTSIVYKANLNFKLAREYLDLLQEQGLIENRLNIYITTVDGKCFLDKAKSVSKIERRGGGLAPHLW